MNEIRINEPSKDPNDLLQQLDEKNKKDYGYYLLRSNYKRVKAHSKYTHEGARSRSPNVPYTFLDGKILKKNPTNSKAVFRQTTDENSEKYKTENKEFKIQRSSETISQHLIRGLAASQPYCYIKKESNNNCMPSNYTNSKFGAYPSWGSSESGLRTVSHFNSEPAENFVNIDMYKRPLTNQPGKIIFDYGRPNNGYYLQRNQYDNTWFNSELELNKTDILKSINPKIKLEYKLVDDLQKSLARSKIGDGQYCTEYLDRFTLNKKKL